MKIQGIINDAYNRCKQILLENQDKLNLIAETLKEVETLDAEQIKSLDGSSDVCQIEREKSSEMADSEDVKVNINTKKEIETEENEDSESSKEDNERSE